ncbi:exodeoxyribonuclease V subunit gamma [Marilutibacter aestuarii]|uniref:RecBCD enzyme subunit RecC n=1 Tax=Marilutibacter aestuarii TaxID=1706195 RepID=A0A508A9R3_9GAMM|nr:exodeoxyribonuclease V subunit gamma [Lysobacter aestuarii]TQD46640.1 exodeoxyribonuclease V subunit gamma [Lysobacter aestuarii]
MPSPPDFRLYHSNALDVLAGLLADALRTPAPGQPLLAPDVVLIPQVAMKRWLQATLAQAHGVAANLEFLTPGEFVRLALDGNGDPADAAEDLDNAALRWRLYAALTEPALMSRPAMASLRAYLADADPLKPWALAVELAGIFEKYQAWRRGMLLDWERQPQLSRLDPQAELWRHIAGGQAHRARRIDRYLSRFGPHDGPVPEGLPARLFAFGTLNVSPDVLRVIATQARVGTLHFYMPTPVGLWWGDLRTASEHWRDVLAGTATETPGENPLLQAWGAAGRDFVAMLGDYETVHPSFEIAVHARPRHDAADHPPTARLLAWLQHDLFHRNARPSGPLRPRLDRDDRSLQVHACHTRLREVQVLHDQLRDLLERDPTLQPREIAVLAPDIDPYIPHIEAVFGGRAGQPDFIPYALADASPLAGEPLAEVFLRLLDLPLARFGLNETLDLLASPPLARAAGLDASAFDRLHHWLRAAGARWGLDARHRESHAAPADDAFTWQFALDRLLLGHASGSEDDISTTTGPTVAPWTGLEGGALDALDVLLRLLRVLARGQQRLGTAMTPARWRERLLGLLAELVPEASTDAAGLRALERLRRLVDDFASSATRADVDQDVPPEAVRAHFAAELGAADTRAPLLTGGISFGRMVPMRLLPFRVIGVLGMNDGDYPRRDPAAGLNKLTADLGTPRRQPGDRSLREDDRFLFLQLFAAASDVFYLSYLGADPRDGSEREPSVLVSELLDVAASHHADSKAVRPGLVVRHPLQPFSPQAFGNAGDAAPGDVETRRFSYRAEWHPAADRDRSGRHPAPAFVAGSLPPVPAATDDATGTLSIDAVRRFLLDPSGEFLRQRLSLRLPEPVASEDDTEPLVVAAGLSRHALQQALFEACLDPAAQARDAAWRTRLHARLRARGLLPAGPVGVASFERLLGEVRPYAEALAAWRGADEATSVAVDIDLGDVRLQGRVGDLYPAGLGRVRIGPLKGPEVIRHGLDWLALCAAGLPASLTRFFETPDKQLGQQQYAAVPTGQAREALRRLLELREQGLREPLPFAPRTGWAYFSEARAERALASAEQAWNGSNGGWGEAHEPAVQVALRGREPFAEDAHGPARADRFREVTWGVFHTLTEGRAHRFADDDVDAKPTFDAGVRP